MIRIELSGGLGNQMFQYALYKKMIHLGKKASLDSSFYTKENISRELELHIFEGIKEDEINQKCGKRSWWRFWKNQDYHDKICVYQPEIFGFNNVNLKGYWQNPRYFEDIRQIILSTFSFRDNVITNENKSLADIMQKENSVSVHIRRGDYVEIAKSSKNSEICNMNYYKNAISYINEHVENPVFYYFSDDIEWVKQNMPMAENMVVVDINLKEQGYLDMYLMTKCRHHIIANSTFSWWGAWLGTNEDKIVVSPDLWFFDDDMTYIICEDWVRIKSDTYA